MARGGFSCGEVRALGADLAQLKFAGFDDATTLREEGGFTASELKEAAFTPLELLEAGFAPADLAQVLWNLKACQEAKLPRGKNIFKIKQSLGMSMRMTGRGRELVQRRGRGLSSTMRPSSSFFFLALLSSHRTASDFPLCCHFVFVVFLPPLSLTRCSRPA